jgi:APA family basic amino acid/polyamine antiporter
VHPKFGTPAVAIAATALWSMVLAATGTFTQLLTYVVFTAWIFYGLGALAVFVFRRTRPDAARPFRVPGYPWTPALFVLAALGIVGSTLVGQPMRALYGLTVLVLGVPAYLIWRTRR